MFRLIGRIDFSISIRGGTFERDGGAAVLDFFLEHVVLDRFLVFLLLVPLGQKTSANRVGIRQHGVVVVKMVLVTFFVVLVRITLVEVIFLTMGIELRLPQLVTRENLSEILSDSGELTKFELTSSRRRRWSIFGN